MKLIKSLIEEGYLKTPGIIKAFESIDREDFLPKNKKKFAKQDRAISIGYNQTNSQPLVVAFMLELLGPKPGEKILDIGSGSGWTSCLLSHIVSNNKENKKGKVFALEIIDELKEFGEENTKKYSFIKFNTAHFLKKDGYLGLEKQAPFDKILCSAALDHKIPKKWKDQLKKGGVIVTPKDSSIIKLKKEESGQMVSEKHHGFSFVPLVKK